MAEIVNPYIAGSPVTGTEMFFGREDVFAFIRHALTGKHRDNVIVLYGQRRTGKTSVLYQMRRQLSERYLCVFVDMHGLALEGLGGLLWELAAHITRVLRRDYQIDLPRLNRVEFAADPRAIFEHDFLNHVWAALGDRHLLLMLDEAIRLQEQILAGRLEKEIFEYLRHLMQHHERLNFLFALGSGLEEMEKEYAFLFSVGLYKKISFLEEDAATALVTEPPKAYYTVTPAALERILQITSGHPYYTQLLCHSLFNHWQRQQPSSLQIEDVDAVLDEVVERGLAVLKHVWEESTPGEKAVLAGMVTAMDARNRPVTSAEIRRAWAGLDVRLPASEAAKAIRSLIARDIIVGREAYVFTVDLQRLWVQKYERLEWVKEEIRAEVQQWAQRSRFTSRPPLLTWVVLGVALGALVLTIALITNRGGASAASTAAGSAASQVVPMGDAAKVSDLAVIANTVWAATEGGLVRWSADDTGELIAGSSVGLDCINAVVAAPDESLWVGCGGVAHVRPDSDRIHDLGFYDRDDGLGMGTVRTLMVDGDGSIWAGGAPDEDRPPPLSRYDGESWYVDEPPMAALAQQQGLELNIRSLLRSRDGALWVGLGQDGVLRWDGQQWTHFGPEQGISRSGEGDERIRRLLEDRGGTIWAAASDRGLLRLARGAESWEKVAVADDAVPIRSVTQLADGSLWAAGDQLIVRSTDGGQSWTTVGAASDGLGSDIGSLLEDATGRIWAGAYQGGVSVFDGQRWRHLQR